MQNNTYIDELLSGPHCFRLMYTHRVRPRWWGDTAIADACFWTEPCLDIQVSSVPPWLRITAGYRLRSTDRCIPFIAVVPDRWSAAKLLATVLADIKTFPIQEDYCGDSHAEPRAVPDDEIPW